MERKDYILIAATLRMAKSRYKESEKSEDKFDRGYIAGGENQYWYVCNHLANEFKLNDDSGFDHNWFMKMCGLVE